MAPSRLFVWTAVVVLVGSTLGYTLAPFLIGQPPAIVVPVTDVQPETGYALVGKLGDPSLIGTQGSSPILLYVVETRRGGILHRYGRNRLKDSRLLGWLRALYEARFPTATYEERILLGSAQSPESEIRELGWGRYAVSAGTVLFSLPLTVNVANVKRVEAVVLGPPAFDATKVQDALQATAIAAAAALALYVLGRLLQGLYRRSIFLRVTVPQLIVAAVPGLIITAVLAIVIFGGGEIYLRSTGYFTKDQSTWVNRYFPIAGILFEPGAEIRQTNGLDFSASNPVNSLGFLDAEPAIPKPAGTFRVLIVGDSMIEAVQVTIPEKVQSVLTDLLRRQYPRLKTDVVAMGYSGTGQANQLGWYRAFKERLKPDLVVLLFVSNDFSNNSVILEGIRQGFYPDRPPWLFLTKDPDGSCREIAPSPDFNKRRIPGGSDADRLVSYMRLFPETAEKFAGWDADKTPIDYMFYESGQLPPVFEEAVATTRCAFALWKKETAQEGVPLIVMAVQHLTGYATAQVPRGPGGKPKTGQMDRVLAIVDELKLPFLDLYKATEKRGNWLEAQFKYDAHWNQTGHRWAAEAILEFLAKGGYLKEPPTRQ